MRAKIAPTLTMLVDEPPDGFGAGNAAKCRAELRALLAVARSAGPGHECGAGAKPKRCALCRALARLGRASRASGRGR